MARYFSNEPDEHVLSLIRPIEAGVLLLIVTVAAFILFLWFVPPAGALVPHYWSKMTANTAAGLLLSALSLALTSPQAPLTARRIGLAAAVIVLALGVVTMAEYITHMPFGIDGFLPYNPHLRYPGRPSLATASEFVFLALCLMTFHHAKSRWSVLADIFALMFTGLTFVMFGGHLYGAIDFFGDNPSNVMAVHTLFLFFCFTALVTIRRAERGGFLAVLLNVGIGSHILRVILPPAIFAPFIFLAADAYLSEAGLMSKSYAQALSSASASTLILFIIVWLGRRINALERDLRDLSLTDELTGVYNRRGFYFLGQQAIREAERGDSRPALFYFDLDGLKRVNDMLGHETGSDMIQSFAALLTKGFRQGDIVGRIGGDEFAVMTVREPGIKLEELLARLNALAATFNDSGERGFRLRFSVGYAELNPGQSETLDDLVTRADAMMYQDKARKRLAA